MKINLRITVLLVLIILVSSTLQAQEEKEIRASLKAGVSQTIGIDTDITISFSRPGVKGILPEAAIGYARINLEQGALERNLENEYRCLSGRTA